MHNLLVRSFFLLLFFSSVLHAVSSMHTDTRAKDHVVLQLHWIYDYSFAGFIMAKEKGFYDDVGLDVELREYKTGMDIEEEVLSGRANYGIYNSQILLDYLQGKPLKLLGSFFKRAALVLVTQPDIRNVSDLKGKIVMGGTKKDFFINFQPFFEKYHLDVDDVKLMPHTYRVKEFIEKKVDAMTAFLSNEVLELRSKGIEFNILDPSDDNLFVMQMELFTSQKEYAAHPKRAKNFILASIKGWEYAFAHPQETIETIFRKYNRGYTKEKLASEAAAIERLILPYTYEIGSIDRSFIKKQAALFRRYYGIQEDRSLEEYIFDPYKKNTPSLTFKERKYIQNHPSIPLCVYNDLFPLDGSVDGKQTGIMGDIFKLISQRSGLRFNVVPADNFEEITKNIREKRCDVLSVATPEIAQNFNLYVTDIFSSSYFAILTSIDKPYVKNPYLLKGKTLLMKDPYLMRYLQKFYPYLNFSLVMDSEEMVSQLMQNKAYGIVLLDEQADYFIDMYGLGKLKLGGFLGKSNPVEAVIGIQKSEPVLASIVEKSIRTITPGEISEIRNSWHMTRYHKQIDYQIVFEIIAVMLLVFAVMYYYQRKIKNFNNELERKVEEKTQELRQINEQLEKLVEQKVEEIVQKDRILAIQSKQAIMGEMITMIAHQWRQPLNTLTLQISNLQLRRLMGEIVDIEEYDKTLEQISRTITYLSETIDDFQTFFHPDRELSKADLKELIERALNFVKPRLKGKNIDIELHVKEGIELNVYVNELIQVLLNILNNAIDALLECGKEQKKIIIKAEAKEYIRIYIQDTACGIDSEIIDRLFEPYFSTKGKNGTGLGLYMSQMIMQKQFGGDIRVESSQQGSTFIIEFPKL